MPRVEAGRPVQPAHERAKTRSSCRVSPLLRRTKARGEEASVTAVTWPPYAPGVVAVWYVDMSGVSVEIVAEHVEWKRLEGIHLLHPDLWHDGVWEEARSS